MWVEEKSLNGRIDTNGRMRNIKGEQNAASHVADATKALISVFRSETPSSCQISVTFRFKFP